MNEKGEQKKGNFTRQADKRENFGALGDLVIQDTSVRLQEASPFVNKELYVISLICPRNKLDARLLLPLFHRAENCSSLVPLICMFENKKSVFYELQWIFGTFIIVAPYFMTKGSQLPCYDVHLRNRS